MEALKHAAKLESGFDLHVSPEITEAWNLALKSLNCFHQQVESMEVYVRNISQGSGGLTSSPALCLEQTAH